MNYVVVINIIFAIISGVFALYLLHFIFFAIVGLFHKNTFPTQEEKLRYGIIISCKDEENVIGRLINSIREADYPQEKLDIFVIAHNCSDKTAEVAKSLGANVIVDNNKEENTLGQAYHYAFPRIENRLDYDGFIFFNADNTMRKDYFNKMNDAFIHYKKKATITSFRSALNMNQGSLPAAYGLYFGIDMMLAFQGRETLKVNSRITGCGFLIPSSRVKDGWECLGLTEDLEYSAEASLRGDEIHFCREAVFYDEQPTKLKTMWHQRLRWSKGTHIVSHDYFLPLLKALFSRKSKRKMSIIVSLTLHSEIVLVSLSLTLLQILLLLLSPLFGVSLMDAFLYWNDSIGFFGNMFASYQTGALFTLAKGLMTFLVTAFITGLVAYIVGYSNYKEFKKSAVIKGLFLIPFFILFQYPIDVKTIFSKSVKWVKIAHGENKE
ncbi:MAG: glycosyltransferase family 2 protein [Bacilli bacterium]|nr:glycosyltransferase family 2 protein [Bacilli bacterium]